MEWSEQEGLNERCLELGIKCCMQWIHSLAYVRQCQALSQVVGAIAAGWPVERGVNPVCINEIHRVKFKVVESCFSIRFCTGCELMINTRDHGAISESMQVIEPSDK